MTVAELYRAEMSKRRWEIPKAQGCPRDTAMLRRVERDKRTRGRKDAMLSRMDKTIARYKKWVRMYEEEGLSLSEIALSEGVTHQSVRRGLAKLGVSCRAKGIGHLLTQLRDQVARLQKDNRILRARLRVRRSMHLEAA